MCLILTRDVKERVLFFFNIKKIKMCLLFMIKNSDIPLHYHSLLWLLHLWAGCLPLIWINVKGETRYYYRLLMKKIFFQYFRDLVWLNFGFSWNQSFFKRTEKEKGLKYDMLSKQNPSRFLYQVNLLKDFKERLI